jgi:hypothetical protein
MIYSYIFILAEEFENDISSTVESILKVLPGVNILIVSKNKPYPLLDIPEENVKVKNKVQIIYTLLLILYCCISQLSFPL